MTDLKDELAALRIEREPERPAAGRWVGWLLVLLVVGGAAAAAGLVAHARAADRGAGRRRSTERAAGTQAAVLNASGYVTARRRATVSSKITGKVVEVNVEEGMAVKEGQVLARLDDSTPRAALALAEAQARGRARGPSPRTRCGSTQARLTLGRATAAREGAASSTAGRARRGAGRRRLARRRASTPRASRSASPSARSRCSRPTSTTRSSARRSAASRSRRTRSRARWCRRSRPAAASRAPASARSSTCGRSRSKSTSTRATSTACSRASDVDGGARRVSRLADPGARHHDGADGRSPEGDGAGAHRRSSSSIRGILPDMGVKVTFLREADAAAPAAPRSRRRSCRRPRCATDGRPDVVFVVRGATASSGARSDVGGADGDRVEVAGRPARPASAWSSSPPAGL